MQTPAAPPTTERARLIMQTLLQMERSQVWRKGAVLQLGSKSSAAGECHSHRLHFSGCRAGRGRLPSRARHGSVWAGIVRQDHARFASDRPGAGGRRNGSLHRCRAHALDSHLRPRARRGTSTTFWFRSPGLSGEQALEITNSLISSNVIDVVVVDSVAALVPKAELEGEMGDSFMGLHARLMSQALRKLHRSGVEGHYVPHLHQPGARKDRCGVRQPGDHHRRRAPSNLIRPCAPR